MYCTQCPQKNYTFSSGQRLEDVIFWDTKCFYFLLPYFRSFWKLKVDIHGKMKCDMCQCQLYNCQQIKDRLYNIYTMSNQKCPIVFEGLPMAHAMALPLKIVKISTLQRVLLRFWSSQDGVCPLISQDGLKSQIVSNTMALQSKWTCFL